MTIKSKHPETIVLHAGHRRDRATNSVAVPIYQTTSYQFHDTGHAADLFGLKRFGNIYTRIMNPTTDVLEQRVAALEGGVAALASRSGQAATAFASRTSPRPATTSSARPTSTAAPGTCSHNTLKDMGIEVRFVDPADPEAFAARPTRRPAPTTPRPCPTRSCTVFPIAEVAESAASSACR